jgi:MFS family permease
MVNIAAGAGALPQREFRIGQVLSKAIDIYGRHIVIFTLVAGTIGLPIVWSGYYLAKSQGNIPSLAPLVGFLAALFLQPLSTAIILYGAFQDMRGLPVSLGESIVRGLGRFPSLLGLMVVSTLGIMLAMLLLLVPGVILMIMWYVAVPACVVEKAGPIGSLGRSQILTKGHRWKLFGLIILVGLLSTVGRVAFSALGTLLGGPVGGLVGETIWQGFAQAFGSVMVVVAYHDLRAAKEGIDIERIAAVFD